MKSGLDGGEHYVAAGTGSSQAVYSFTGLAAGTYQIYATWSTFGAPSTIASNTPYTFYNGGTVAGAATVNQQVAPSGVSFSNTPFQLIGSVTLCYVELVAGHLEQQGQRPRVGRWNCDRENLRDGYVCSKDRALRQWRYDCRDGNRSNRQRHEFWDRSP